MKTADVFYTELYITEHIPFTSRKGEGERKKGTGGDLDLS